MHEITNLLALIEGAAEAIDPTAAALPTIGLWLDNRPYVSLMTTAADQFPDTGEVGDRLHVVTTGGTTTVRIIGATDDDPVDLLHELLTLVTEGLPE